MRSLDEGLGNFLARFLVRKIALDDLIEHTLTTYAQEDVPHQDEFSVIHIDALTMSEGVANLDQGFIFQRRAELEATEFPESLAVSKDVIQ